MAGSMQDGAKKSHLRGADGRGLGDDGVAVLQRGHFAHGIDGQVIRRLLLPFGQAKHVEIVRLAYFFEHPAGDR